VITGASGFIGRHLAENLSLIKNVDVVRVSRQNLSGFVRVLDYKDSPSGDVLIHLAEESRLDQARNLRDLDIKQKKLTLDQLLKKNFSRIIYISSSVVYGDKFEAPRAVGDPVFCDSHYTQLKLESEEKVLGHFNGVVLRLSNVYGPGMSDSNVISKILRQIPSHGDIEVFDARPVRDFIWIHDVVEGIKSIALLDNKIEIDRIFNLGSGVGTSIGDLAKLILRILGQSHRNITTKSLNSEFSHCILDITDLTLLSRWRPKVVLKDGLEILVNKELLGRVKGLK
jgi:UDP-glucose 4-epimerase